MKNLLRTLLEIIMDCILVSIQAVLVYILEISIMIAFIAIIVKWVFFYGKILHML